MTKPMPHTVNLETAHVGVQQALDAAVMTKALALLVRVRRVLALWSGAVGVGEGEPGEQAQAPEAGEGVAVLGVGLGDVLEEVGLDGAGDEGVGVQGGAQAGVGEGEVQDGEEVEVGGDFEDDVVREGLEGGEGAPLRGLWLRHGGGGRGQRGHGLVLGEEGEELGEARRWSGRHPWFRGEGYGRW